MNIRNIGVLLIPICVLGSLANARGDDKTNKWGPAVEGVQILLKPDDSTRKTEPYGQQVLIVMVTNNSKNNVILSLPNLRPSIWFSVTSPSGADLSTKEPVGSVKGSHVVPPVLKPQESLVFRFPINEICPLQEAGVYKYFANTRILSGATNFVVKSVVLDVTLTPKDVETAAKKTGGF